MEKVRANRLLSSLLAAAVALGYVCLDAADVVPGFLTTKPAPVQPASFPQFPKRGADFAPQERPSTSDLSAPTDLIPDLTKKLDQFRADPRLAGAKAGIWLQSADGQKLAEMGGNEPLTPASSTKVYTAAAALHKLGEKTRLRTVVYWDPSGRKLYLLAGGDVFLGPGTSDPLQVRGHAGLQSLVSQVIASLTYPAQGGKARRNELTEKPFQVVLDTSFFGSQPVNPHWKDDEQQFAGALHGLAIDTGRVAPRQWKFHPDPAVYAASVFTAELDRQLQLFAQNAGAGKTSPPNQKPKQAPAPLPAHQLVQGQWPGKAATLVAPWSEPVSRASNASQIGRAGAVVGVGYSATLAQQVRLMLKESDNTVAETLGRLVSLAAGSDPTFEAAGRAVLSAVRELGVETGHSVLTGCSGLSKDTKITARSLAQIVALSLSGKAKDLDALEANLPVAGSDGTLANAYRGTAVAGRLRAKTGTLMSTTSLTGWFDRGGKIVVFCFILTDYPPQQSGEKIVLKQDLFRAFLGEKFPDPPATKQPNPTEA